MGRRGEFPNKFFHQRSTKVPVKQTYKSKSLKTVFFLFKRNLYAVQNSIKHLRLMSIKFSFLSGPLLQEKISDDWRG